MDKLCMGDEKEEDVENNQGFWVQVIKQRTKIIDKNRDSLHLVTDLSKLTQTKRRYFSSSALLHLA